MDVILFSITNLCEICLPVALHNTVASFECNTLKRNIIGMKCSSFIMLISLAFYYIRWCNMINLAIIHIFIYYNAYYIIIILYCSWLEANQLSIPGGTLFTPMFDRDPEACLKSWWGLSQFKSGAHNILKSRLM